jgi:phenylacetate-coenzyme A ligase PaaK-like adenylate-forming protein
MVDFIVDIRLLEITEPFERIVSELNAMKPFAIHSYPSMLDVLATYQERGELRIRPWIVTSGGEPFGEDVRRRILRAWPKVPIVDIYACTEALSISKTCLHGTYHVNEDWIVVENVDGDGRPVPTGERGDKIYVTALHNYLQPLIRYEVTDSVVFDDGPCPCGQPTMGIKILGRTNHTLTLPGEREGATVMILPTPLLVAFMDVPGLRQYQIVQEARDHLHINFVPEDGVDIAALHTGIERLMRQYLGKHAASPSIRLTYTHVPKIPRDPRTHKVMQIINKEEGVPAGALAMIGCGGVVEEI